MVPQDFLNQVALEYRVSKSELAALSLANQGLSTVAIAEKLGISGDAVRKRLSEVYQKFGIKGRGPVKLTKLQQILVNRYQTQRPSAQPFNSAGKPNPPAGRPEGPLQDWGEAPDVSLFYGRKSELSQLTQWILKDQCRLVILQGMAGMGKTTLAVKFAKQTQSNFDSVVWRSLRHAPPLDALINTLIQSLSGSPPQELNNADLRTEDKLAWLMTYLRNHRCLIILDGGERILSSGELAGVYKTGYEGYGELLQRIGEEPHRSCLMLTSREKVSEISVLEGETAPVRSLQVSGLGEQAAEILKAKGLSGRQYWPQLIQGYRSNPLLLKLVAANIKEIFDGDVRDFLTTTSTLFTHDVSDFVEEMLERLSDLETTLIQKLASHKQPLGLPQLQAHFPQTSTQDLMRAIASLRQRSLIERVENGFIPPPVVMEVLTQTMEGRAI